LIQNNDMCDDAMIQIILLVNVDVSEAAVGICARFCVVHNYTYLVRSIGMSADVRLSDCPTVGILVCQLTYVRTFFSGGTNSRLSNFNK
jgi:hypothetical protein